MRIPPALVPALLSLALAARGGAQNAAHSPAPGSSAAAPATPPATRTYRSDTLHLSYSYPVGYTDASAIVGTAFKASVGESPLVGKEAAHCITLPLSAMSTAGGQLAIVLLVRLDAVCLKRNFTAEQLPEVTAGEVQGLSASGAKPAFGEPVRFLAGGHAAEQLQGTFTLPTGDAMHAMVTCVLLKPDIACWQFLGNSDESIRAMRLFPVTFDGEAPSSLVPPPAAKP